jgi:hypothetical protein
MMVLGLPVLVVTPLGNVSLMISALAVGGVQGVGAQVGAPQPRASWWAGPTARPVGPTQPVAWSISKAASTLNGCVPEILKT